ncbi:hypothetical protein [Sphingomonas abietis]|uniref:Ricin B lectin domain-containing protein n=1 Tax=Sphingomonas abietis TaxID=3012344 RepID=A0ABY7NJK1_9SPHN|nr:hypothetical protein [Sphingomonas abietis]WBO21668.1 hypothetical protein PBT88_16030 [Sphingomonas abietis]
MINTNARRAVLGFAIASVALCVSAPAFAHAQAASIADGSTMRFNAKTGDYCLSSTVTGSRIAQVTCQSESAWAADGLTISRK